MKRFRMTPARRWALDGVERAYGVRERLPAILREPKAETLKPEQPPTFSNVQTPIGKVLKIIRGTVPCEGHCIWAHGPYGAGDDPALWDAAYAFCFNAYTIEHTILKVWVAEKLKYDVTGEVIPTDVPIHRLYHGAANQTPDPRIVEIEGEDMAPGWPHVIYAVVEAVNLRPFGNRPPPVSALVSTSYNQPQVDEYVVTDY